MFLLVGCSIDEILNLTETPSSETANNEITPIEELTHTENFKSHALAHILEGEINRKGQAVGFHYNQLRRRWLDDAPLALEGTLPTAAVLPLRRDVCTGVSP